MNALVIVPATPTRDGEETGALSTIQEATLLGRLLDRLGSVDKLEAVVVNTGDDPEDAAIRRPRGTLEMCHARRAAASASGLTIGSEHIVPLQT
jgi:hypothetical protein